MTAETWIVLAVLLAMVAIFVTDRLPPETVAVGGLLVLLLGGVLTAGEALAGFGNPATVTVACMFILSAGLQKTGALSALGAWLMRAGRWPAVLLLLVMVVAGSISAFVNNTAAVAVLMPLVLAAARARGMAASRFLIPLSYASQFGGVCTLIGTSTNLLVASIAQRAGQPPFGMFEFGQLGLLLFATGTLYVWLLGPVLLPPREAGEYVERYGLGEYFTEFRVSPGSRLIGRRASADDLTELRGLTLVEVLRDKQRLFAPAEEVLRAGDVLLVRGETRRIVELKGRAGLEINPEFKLRDAVLQGDDIVLGEAIIAPGAPFAGLTLEDLRFGDRHELIVLALQRRDGVLRESLALTPLEIGDLLLVLGRRAALDRLTRDRDFILLGEVNAPKLTRGRVPRALAIMAGVVGAAGLGWIDILPAAMLGCLALWATGCLRTEEVFESVQWRVIVLLAAMIPLGTALEKSGGVAFVVQQVFVALPGGNPLFALAAVYLLTAVLTEFMSNNATAVLLAPLALGLAQQLGVDPKPFLMAVAFAASTSFATPVGYQTNAMVHTAGGYRFTDFMRIGIPLNVLFFAVAMWGIPRFWPF